MRRNHALVLALCLAALAGCGDDDPARPAGPAPDAFWEPLRFCVTGSATGDTLLIYNLGEGPLEWAPQRVPAGSAGLSPTITVAPGRGVAVPWQWNPAGPYPVTDTLLARTNDPSRPTATVIFRREDPAAVDPRPVVPLAPILGFPADGAVFGAGTDTVLVGWSREDPCSGGVEYILQVASDPGFTSPLLSETVPFAEAALIIEPGDRGTTAFWRVRTRALLGGLSPWSATRSWSLD